MSQPIHRLVYISANEIQGQTSVLDAEIDRILEVARSNNDKAGITGALLFNANCFAQVLEGPQSEIQDTFERIQCDTRHSRVSILAFDPAMERNFPNWSMGYMGQITQAAEQFRYIAESSGFNAADLQGDHILELLQLHMAEAEAA